jgi:hypothetical protein
MPILEQEESPRNPIIERVSREAGLPVGVRVLLENAPSRGEHLHQWVYDVSRQLHAHLTADSITGLLLAICDAEEREILDAVANSAKTAWQPREPWPKASLAWLEEHAPARHDRGGSPRESRGVRSHAPAVPKWPLPDLEVIERIALAGPSLTELRAESHFNFGSEDRFTKWFLPILFPWDSLLCLAGNQRSAITLPMSEWLKHHLELYSFVVPSPMSASTGMTAPPDAHVSERCLENTGPRRYLVIEFDFSELAKDGKETRYAPLIRRLRVKGISILDLQAALLRYLEKLLPLVMAVFSGGRSLQGWFRVSGIPDTELLEFMRLAVSLGADAATWCKCQLVRLPDGSRLNAAGMPGARQTVEYFAEGGL